MLHVREFVLAAGWVPKKLDEIPEHAGPAAVVIVSQLVDMDFEGSVVVKQLFRPSIMDLKKL